MTQRQELMAYLHEKGICTTFHYVPLHSSEAGIKFGRFHSNDRYTTVESERLLRLPLYYNLTFEEIEFIVTAIYSFFEIR